MQDPNKKRKRSTVDELSEVADSLPASAKDSALLLADYAPQLPSNIQSALLSVFNALSPKLYSSSIQAPKAKKPKANLADIENPFPDDITKGDLRDMRNNYKKIFAPIKNQITWDKQGGNVDFSIGMLPRDFWMVFFDVMTDSDADEMKDAIAKNATKKLQLNLELSFKDAKAILGPNSVERTSRFGSVHLIAPIKVSYSNHKARVTGTFKKW